MEAYLESQKFLFIKLAGEYFFGLLPNVLENYNSRGDLDDYAIKLRRVETDGGLTLLEKAKQRVRRREDMLIAHSTLPGTY